MSQVKTAISIDRDIFRAIDLLAKKAHISRSRFFEIAVRAWVKKEEGRDLTARINRAVDNNRLTSEETRQTDEMRRHQLSNPIGTLPSDRIEEIIAGIKTVLDVV